MNKVVKFFVVFVAVTVVAFAGMAVFVRTVNADKYRPQLVDVLSKKTGRTVKLNGPISLSLGFGGLRVGIRDVSLSNPSWASRPSMAGMGKFELGVSVWPLLSKRLAINELSIENADILLETNAAGQHNWEFAPPVVKEPVEAETSASSATPSGSLSISSLKIVNSQVAMRGSEGKVSGYNIASLVLGMRGTGAELKVRGDVNGAPLVVVVKTSVLDLLSKDPFTFDADATFNVLHLALQGKADLGNNKADVSAYELTAGKTKITGDVSVVWGGVRPVVRGSLNSDHLDLADFRAAAGTDKNAVATKAAAQARVDNTRLFSDAPLPLDALKSADAEMNVAVGEFTLGSDALKQVSAKLVLSGGNLVMAPVKANVGTSPVEVQVKLSAAQPLAHLAVGLTANAVDLGDLQKLGGMSAFMTGKASANIQLAGDGNSAHDIASSLGGVMTITAEKGEIMTGAAANISSSLAGVFSAGGGNDALNCLAVRFIAKNGVMTDNGILIDSAASTVAGGGSINLNSETVKLELRAKTKLVDIGGLVPAMQITGNLANPSYSVDASGMVKNVVGSLMNGNVDVLGSNVADMQTAPNGQNACVFTLNHPKKVASSNILSSDPVSKAGQKIQNLGNSLVKGLFGQ